MEGDNLLLARFLIIESRESADEILFNFLWPVYPERFFLAFEHFFRGLSRKCLQPFLYFFGKIKSGWKFLFENISIFVFL